MTGDAVRTVAPGGTIGMLGGGQLGRMTALAAAQLGYKTHVFSPEADSPCAQVSAAETVARYSDHEALARFARSVDVVTLEWENIPVQTRGLPRQVRPRASRPRRARHRPGQAAGEGFRQPPRHCHGTVGARPLPRSGGDGLPDHRHALRHEIGAHGL